jgi:hypothetical protein
MCTQDTGFEKKDENNPPVLNDAASIKQRRWVIPKEQIKISMIALQAIHTLCLLSKPSKVEDFMKKYPVNEGYVYHNTKDGKRMIALSAKKFIELDFIAYSKITIEEASDILEMGVSSGLLNKYEIQGDNQNKFEYYCSDSLLR